MKIRKTTIAAAVFMILVIAAALFIVHYGTVKAMEDVREYEKTGKTKYEYKLQNYEIDYEINDKGDTTGISMQH
ncbi:MAG: hypothetical protein LBO06_06580 [Bacteroidales bacterium]|jgi:uncharacterized membrane protein|nr:hypothetical protein [Bacteroidales bacterium]